jgi:hypothetical protein
LAEVRPNRPPKADDLDAFNAFIEARAERAARQAALEADPVEIRARARERRLLRLLAAMVLVIVIGSFAISIAFVLITGGSGAPGGH